MEGEQGAWHSHHGGDAVMLFLMVRVEHGFSRLLVWIIVSGRDSHHSKQCCERSCNLWVS